MNENKEQTVGSCDGCDRNTSLFHTVEGKWLCILCLIEYYKRCQIKKDERAGFEPKENR